MTTLTTPFHEAVYKKLEGMYSGLATAFYLDDEDDFSFSIPILNFDVSHKDKDSDEVLKESLDAVIEVVFRPYEDGLKVSHRVQLKRHDSNELFEFDKPIDFKKHNLKHVCSEMSKNCDFNIVETLGRPKLSVVSKTFVNKNEKLATDYEIVYNISAELVKKVKSDLIKVDIQIDSLEFVESNEKTGYSEPYFDTMHCYIIK